MGGGCVLDLRAKGWRESGKSVVLDSRRDEMGLSALRDSV